MEAHSDERSAPVRDGAGQTHPAWTAIRTHLEALKGDLFARISAYPPPITACDDQFSYLLEQRDAVAGELSRLDAALARSARECATERDVDVAVEAFLRTSPCIDADAARRLRESRGARKG
jgi:hypothetical protein